MATEPRNVLLFKEWFVSHGGSFHPGVRYSKSSSGFSIVARETIEPDATIVTCPFSMIITPVLAKDALLPILQLQAMMERWTERQSIIVYVCFHWIASPEIYDTLIHTPYLNTLPSPSQLRTTLHFTQAELDALRGTNLYGATLDRRQVWETEWEECRADISAVNAEWGKEFTWCVPFSGFITGFCVCVWMLGFPCLCQGAVPDGIDVPVFTCLSFHSPILLLVTLPRPAPARPMPRAYPRHRRAQPRACSTRFVGRPIIARLRIRIRSCCNIARDSRRVKSRLRDIQQLRSQTQL